MVGIAIEKATLMYISEANYTSSTIRRKAASWMRITEEIQERWIENERLLRDYFRRNRGNTDPSSQHDNGAITIEYLDSMTIDTVELKVGHTPTGKMINERNKSNGRYDHTVIFPGRTVFFISLLHNGDIQEHKDTFNFFLDERFFLYH